MKLLKSIVNCITNIRMECIANIRMEPVDTNHIPIQTQKIRVTRIYTRESNSNTKYLKYDDPEQTSLSKKLLKFMENNQMSQKEFCVKYKVKRETLQQWLHYNKCVRPENIQKLCNIDGCGITEADFNKSKRTYNKTTNNS